MKPRPRLAEHALLRRHVVDGVEKYVVHHAATGGLVTLDARAAALVQLADGTRDLDGISLAASRAGLYRRASEIEALFDALDGHDLLADGIEPGPIEPDRAVQWSTPAAPDARARPVRVLGGFDFTCTGGGACCSQYASVALTADDARRATRGGLVTLEGDSDAERVFLPLYGGVRRERVAITLVDGRCLQLDDAGKCALHVRAGADAKPVGCRMYPATFADDGETIRVSCAVECECVSKSVVEPGGGPLIDVAFATAGDLPDGVTVRVVPDPIVLGEQRSAPRAAVVRWTDAAASQVEATDGDAVAMASALARRLDAVGVDLSFDNRFAQDELEVAVVSLDLSPSVERLARAMSAAADAADRWRSPRDRTRRLRRAVAVAAKNLLARGIPATLSIEAPPEHTRIATFALRAALFGHLFVDARPVAEALRDFGARLLVARDLAVGGSTDLGEPIAAVMAACRGTS